MCGHQELHSCGTSAHHPAGHRLLVSPLHPLGSPGCCFCDSGDSCVCGSMCCVIFRDLSDRCWAHLLPPPPRLSGPSLSVSFLGASTCFPISCQLQPAFSQPPESHRQLLQLPWPTPFWNTAAKLSSEHSALTHRHSRPRYLPVGIPASSEQRAGSRAFRVLVPLLPEHPAQAGCLAGHSQQLCSTSAWGRGGKGIPRPKLTPGAVGYCPQGTQFLFPWIDHYGRGGELLQLSCSEAFYQGPDSSLQGSYSLPLCSCHFVVLGSAVSSSSAFRASAPSWVSWNFAVLKRSLCLSSQSWKKHPAHGLHGCRDTGLF